MLQQWQALFTEIEIIQQNPQILNEEELSRFETENNIILPTGYKEFCQTFGTGCFGDFVRIYCSEDLITYSNLSLEAIKEEIESYPSEQPDRDSNFQSILANGFVFCDDFGANIAVWDFRTYSEIDESYDIYWIDIDASDDNLCRVGRDFFEFITNFCLGQDAYHLLPQEKRPLTSSIPQTFTQFSSV